MNQESTCSVHQNKVFCFKQTVVQINQGYVGQQCPWSVYLGDSGFLHSGEIPASCFDLKSFVQVVRKKLSISLEFIHFLDYGFSKW